ncbi:hypothetical protein [Bradyrhizobium sp. RT6a]|uniref:hypothetical protein n=1 Tax=unclassified Bradyrhizobium TaxID=2631580 RepID=UPI00339B949D
MTAAIEALIKKTDELRRALKSGPGAQIQASTDCDKIRTLCAAYFETRSAFADSEDSRSTPGVSCAMAAPRISSWACVP